MKCKMQVDDQITQMKSKGIKFDVVSEKTAKDFLTYNTYFFKLKSYAKSFERKSFDKTYVNLDFAYIMELSTLDAHFRQLIINISLSIEHMLKTMLIRDITLNPNEDGYAIINKLFNKYPFIKTNIDNKKNDSACADLAHKYYSQWPIWAIVEVLTFGDFIKLFNMYYEKYPSKESKKIQDLLWSAKFIRNAAAHNNCLLNSLRIPYMHTHLNKNNKISATKRLQQEVSKIPNTSKSTRKKFLGNPVIHDFIATLFLFDWICTSEAMKCRIYGDVNKLFKSRFLIHC